MNFLNFVVVDPRGPYLYWRDADGGAFTRASAESFAERHNSLIEANVPELDGQRLKVCELLPTGHRQRVCELSVNVSDVRDQLNEDLAFGTPAFDAYLALERITPTLHDLAHEAA
jgi:hypothetical protein